MCFNLAFILSLTCQEVYAFCIKRDYFQKFNIPLFDAESYKEWNTIIKLAVPTTFLNCIEWWAFEFVIIFSGWISVATLTAQVAIMQCNACIFMFSLGM